MCHFHQKMIVRRYLTCQPKLQPAIEFGNIMKLLCFITKPDFEKEVGAWYSRWQTFLKERTINPFTGKWFYTHKRIRSAYRSIKTNMPYLFTYLKYPEMNIPNTTNHLDGSFTHLKTLLRVHRGLKKELKLKIIGDYLDK